MKTNVFSIGIIFVVLLVCTTCTKEEVMLTPNGESSALKSASAENAIITVAPVAGDDTDNIRSAFEDAKSEGPGTIVFLTAGVFQISEVIEVVDFDGTFMGAGQGYTTIEIGSIGGTYYSPFQFILGEMSSLDLTVTDLLIRFTAPAFKPAIYIPGIFTGGTRVLSGHININNINIEGGSGILIANVENVEAIIEGCHINNTYEGVVVGNMLNSRVTVRENHFKNHFDGILLWDNQGSSFCIERNTFENADSNPTSRAVWSLDFPRTVGLNVPNNILMQHNSIESKDGSQVVIFQLLDSKMEIKSNNFNLNASQDFSGIYIGSASDLLISNNKFSGEAGSAIIADDANGMVVLGDNINQLTALSGFPVQLLENTSYCTVVGNAKDNVLDLGTDNILTGVTRQTGPAPGPMISEALSDRIQQILSQYNFNL